MNCEKVIFKNINKKINIEGYKNSVKLFSLNFDFKNIDKQKFRHFIDDVETYNEPADFILKQFYFEHILKNEYDKIHNYFCDMIYEIYFSIYGSTPEKDCEGFNCQNYFEKLEKDKLLYIKK
uniref:Uncharacterized protein n=1 Tax=viral metagenome TaxID=1070528 RepID=A0A6C0AEL8_9ZZZZ